MPSSTETSWPSRARTRIGRRSRETQSSEPSRLPATPAFMGFLDETALVDQRLDARAQALVQVLGARRELRVDRETLAKDEALAFGRAPELGDQRPRFLGVDVVERERRDSAPIVETRREEAGIDQRREVRRRLDVHVWAEDEPRHRERPQEILERGLGRLPHRDPRLGAEVLDDDLLDVAVRFVEVADRDERVDPLASRLADADEQTGRERDPELAGQREQRFLRAQAPAGLRERDDLVGFHRVSARLARVAAKGAIAAVVATERRQRHEDLRRKSHGAAPAAIAHLAGADEQVVQPGRSSLDERARFLVRDHARRRAAFGFDAVERPPADDAAALRPPVTFGRTSPAKRSMFAMTARSSCTV